jgi:AcrR family transcriptional regulator
MRAAKAKPAPHLTRERIAEVALAQIDKGGRAALSMRSLAAGLGCEAMSLYHHVDGMDGVLDAVVDRLLGSIPANHPRQTDPRKALEVFAKAYLALAQTHPNAFPLVATRLWRTPAAQATAGLGVKLLRDLGLPPRTAFRQARIIGAYLNGAGLALAAWRATGDTKRGAMKTTAANDSELAALATDMNEAAVRADLEAGLKQWIDALDRKH